MIAGAPRLGAKVGLLMAGRGCAERTGACGVGELLKTRPAGAPLVGPTGPTIPTALGLTWVVMVSVRSWKGVGVGVLVGLADGLGARAGVLKTCAGAGLGGLSCAEVSGAGWVCHGLRWGLLIRVGLIWGISCWVVVR